MNASNVDHNESMGDAYNRKQRSEGKTEASMGMGSGLPAVEKMMKMAAGSGATVTSAIRDKKERAQLLLGAPCLCEHAGRCPASLARPLRSQIRPHLRSLLPPNSTATHAYASLVLGLLALVFPWTWGVFFTDGDMWDGVKGHEVGEHFEKVRRNAEPGHADHKDTFDPFEAHQVRDGDVGIGAVVRMNATVWFT